MPAHVVHEISLRNAVAKIAAICADSGGRSQFFPWGGSGYKASVTHYYESSTELSHAAVQPGSAEDLQEIIKVIAETRVPFAVKSGGHNSNPRFSSTKGIQIFLVRFNKITVHAEEKLVDVGAGCLFGELYRALVPYNLNIVGGSGLAGIGVAGWLLGGGYSVKTSQYGLGIDNIKSVKIVLPDGSAIKEVRKESEDEYDKNLFTAIKGGGNNFGIVTEFTLEAHVQERDYYNFTLTYELARLEAVRGAIVNFLGNPRWKVNRKANLEPAFRSRKIPNGVKRYLDVSCVYDGSLGGNDPFRRLIAIEHEIQNYGTEYPPAATTSSGTRTKKHTVTTSVETPSTEISSAGTALTTIALTGTSAFYQADAFHSYAGGTHELSDLPGGLLGPGTPYAASYGAPYAPSYVDPYAGSYVAQSYAVISSAPSLSKAPQLRSLIRASGQGSLAAPNSAVIAARPMPGISQFPRGRWGCVMVDEFTEDIIKIIEEEQNRATANLTKDWGGTRVDIGFWPFTKSMFDKSTDPTSSAWPHKKDEPNCPILAYFTWEGENNDIDWVREMKTTLKNLRDEIHKISSSSEELPYFISAALAEDVEEDGLKVLYRDNLEMLGQFRGRYDPYKVMDLTGGFKIPIIEEEEEAEEADA